MEKLVGRGILFNKCGGFIRDQHNFRSCSLLLSYLTEEVHDLPISEILDLTVHHISEENSTDLNPDY